MKYGKYSLIIATHDVTLGEHTNIGVILFDETGKLVGVKVDGKRAKMRGDLMPYYILDMLEENYKRRFPTLKDLEKTQDTMAHCMSSIQTTGVCATLLRDNTLDDLFRRFVLGEK
jgi:hypothetical protein